MAKKKMDDSVFFEALKGINLPILILDTRWHELFPDHEKTNEIRKLENQINKLLKEQGKLVSDVKDMKRLKTVLMQNIVHNMDNGDQEDSKKKMKQQVRDQKMVMEINGKVTASEERLLEIPYEIKNVNQKLLVEGMRICYERLKANREKIAETEQWVVETREELKNRILEKQDMKMKNDLIYSTMHAVVGAKIIEVFDKDNQRKEEES